jgi:hypothetical protein
LLTAFVFAFAGFALVAGFAFCATAFFATTFFLGDDGLLLTAAFFAAAFLVAVLGAIDHPFSQKNIYVTPNPQ